MKNYRLIVLLLSVCAIRLARADLPDEQEPKAGRSAHCANHNDQWRVSGSEECFEEIESKIDAKRFGGSLRAKIGRTHKVFGEDVWVDVRRTRD